MSFLTNYDCTSVQPSTSCLDKVGNFCLAPLVTACGREVKVNQIKEENLLIFKEQDPHNILIRILAVVGAIVLFPMTLAGLGCKWSSSTHTQNVNDESSYIERRKAVQNEIEDILKPSEQKEIDRLTDMAHLVHRAMNQEFKLDLFPLLNKMEEIFINFLEKDSDQLSEEFKSSISYEDLKHLKGVLSLLAYYQDKGRLPQNGTEEMPFKAYHQLIRQFYYDRFAADHLVANLREKSAIPSIEAKLEDIIPNSADQLDSILEDIQEAFADEHNPSRVTWLHGTQSPTLASILNSDQLLKHSGHLRRDNQLAFCGENGMGFAFSQTRISGVCLESCHQAISYSTGNGMGYHNDLSNLCLFQPKKGIEHYSIQFEKWI